MLIEVVWVSIYIYNLYISAVSKNPKHHCIYFYILTISDCTLDGQYLWVISVERLEKYVNIGIVCHINWWSPNSRMVFIGRLNPQMNTVIITRYGSLHTFLLFGVGKCRCSTVKRQPLCRWWFSFRVYYGTRNKHRPESGMDLLWLGTYNRFTPLGFKKRSVLQQKQCFQKLPHVFLMFFKLDYLPQRMIGKGTFQTCFFKHHQNIKITIIHHLLNTWKSSAMVWVLPLPGMLARGLNGKSRSPNNVKFLVVTVASWISGNNSSYGGMISFFGSKLLGSGPGQSALQSAE